MAIRHLVFLDIQTDSEAIEHVHNGLKNLSANPKIGCKRFEFHACQTNNKFTHYFLMDFETVEDRDGYLNHPDHVAVATQVIIPVLKNGIESAMVFDYEKAILKAQPSTQKGPKGYLFSQRQIVTSGVNDKTIYSQKDHTNVSPEEGLAKYSYMRRVTLKSDDLMREKPSSDSKAEQKIIWPAPSLRS